MDWSIVGPIVNKSSNESVKCNCIAVKDVISGTLASHHFTIDNRLKRSEMFKRMLHNDFSKVKQLQLNIIRGIEEIPREDKKYLKVLETRQKEKW